MKIYLLLISMLISTLCNAQNYFIPVSGTPISLTPTAKIPNDYIPNFKLLDLSPENSLCINGQKELFVVKSLYDTAILYKGNATCSHEWVFKQRVLKMTSCAVSHGPAGCPDGWLNEFRICKKCLRHENITEMRIVETKEDEYESLASKLRK